MNKPMTLKRNKSFWDIWDAAGIYIFLGIILIPFIIVTISVTGEDWGSNIMNVLQACAITAVCASGMTFAITSGGFDLSVGSIAAITSSITGVYIKSIIAGEGDVNSPITVLVCILFTIGVGIVCGIINGVIITKLKIQTFVATLATMSIFRGIAFVITQSTNQAFSSYQGLKFLTTGISPIIIMAIAFALCFFLYRYTRFGVYVRSVGSNESAARISGVKADWVFIKVFIYVGLVASIAGLMTAATLNVGSAGHRTGFELDVISAVVLGGTALAGGRGNVFGTLAAAILVCVVINMVNLLQVPDMFQYLIRGSILILALAMNSLREKARNKE